MKILKVQLVVTIVLSLFALAQQSSLSSGAGFATSAPTALSEIPRLIKYSGTAKDESGKPLPGTVGATFALYKDAQGGAALWLETQNVQADAAGHYQIMLGAGSSTGLPSDVFEAGEARWVGVQIAGQAEQPRVMLVSVPYALKAGDAETIGGLPASAFMRASGDVSQGGGVGKGPLAPAHTVTTNSPYGTNGYLPVWTSSSTIQNSNVFQNSTGNLGVGTTSPGATLDVSGTGNFRGLVTFAAGQTFPGTAQLAAANTFTGNQTVNGNLSATGAVTGSMFNIGSNLFGFGNFGLYDAFVGFAGNPTSTGGSNTGMGVGALAANTSGSLNTAVGTLSLTNNTSGNENTAVGDGSLASNVTGFDSTAVGVDALASSTAGYNTAVGSAALYDDTTGTNNAAMGGASMSFNSTGSNNTAVGAYSFQLNTTGSNNTAIGYAAGYTPDRKANTGSNNTFLGYFSVVGGPNETTVSNATAIGANAEVDQNNAMVLGSINGVNGATASAFVGIGTTTPAFLLHIGNQGGVSFNNFLRVEGPASGSGNAISVGGHGDLAVDAPGVVAGRFVVKDNGVVAIGIPNPLGNPFQIAQGRGSAIADGWATYSSRRWKTNIHQLSDALARVQRLRGVSYDLQSSGKHEIGVIAEEVGAVVPEVVTYEENGKDARGVDYSRLTALLIEAVKQQQMEIAALRKQTQEIKVLRRQLAELQRERRQVETASLK